MNSALLTVQEYLRSAGLGDASSQVFSIALCAIGITALSGAAASFFVFVTRSILIRKNVGFFLCGVVYVICMDFTRLSTRSF